MTERNETSLFTDNISASTNESELEDANDATDDRSDATAAELQRLEAENADLKDQFLRLRAEFENFRRRVVKEKEDLQEYASIEALRPLLAIADDFERALGVPCADAEYAKGMQLIYQRLGDTFRKGGIEPMESQGQPFDPNLHHAIEMVKTAEAPDNTVLEVYQTGYRFKGKLLRPAVVKVAVAPDENGGEDS